MSRRHGSGEGQYPLFDGAPEPRPDPPKKRRERYHTDKAAADFMTENPIVLTMMADFLLRLYDEGRARYGMQAIQENFRWHRHIPGLPDPEETRKLNNNYTSRIARAVIVMHPELGDMLELRALKHSRWPDPPKAIHIFDEARGLDGAAAWTLCGHLAEDVALSMDRSNCTRCKKAAVERAFKIEGGEPQ